MSKKKQRQDKKEEITSIKDFFKRPNADNKPPLKERLSEEEYNRRLRKSNIVIFSSIGILIVLGIILGFMMIPRY